MSMVDHMLEPPPPRPVRRLEVITGPGGRRRWTADEKARILEEATAPGAVVSEVARRNGMSPQHLFTWGRQARREADNRVTGLYGVPQTIRVDNGPEFVSRALDLWAYQHGVVLDFSRPGKPTDNSFVEAFNGKVRAECIDQNSFLSLADARLKCEAFRHEYNGERPHSSIGHKTPSEFIKSIGAPSQPMEP